jgi:hypothetical protein
VSSVLYVNSVLGNFLLRPKERSELFSVINGNQTTGVGCAAFRILIQFRESAVILRHY